MELPKPAYIVRHGGVDEVWLKHMVSKLSIAEGSLGGVGNECISSLTALPL
jgi:hypothetical protein